MGRVRGRESVELTTEVGSGVAKYYPLLSVLEGHSPAVQLLSRCHRAFLVLTRAALLAAKEHEETAREAAPLLRLPAEMPLNHIF